MYCYFWVRSVFIRIVHPLYALSVHCYIVTLISDSKIRFKINVLRYGSFEFRFHIFRSVRPNETSTAFCIISVSRSTFEVSIQPIYWCFWRRDVSKRIILCYRYIHTFNVSCIISDSKIMFKVNVLRYGSFDFRVKWRIQVSYLSKYTSKWDIHNVLHQLRLSGF